MTLHRRHLLLLTALLAGLPLAANAQPSRPIRLVVPYPPGGPLDTVARLLAERVKDTLGVVVVDNRPGAGGNLGADLVAKAAPDGHTIVMGAVATHAINPWLFGKLPYDPVKDFSPITLVMGAVATHAINPWLFAKLPYDPVRDFTPITQVAAVPNVLVMNTEIAQKLGIRSLRDLVAHARKNPGQLNYGSGGNGSAGHLAGEMFKAQAGLFMVHIPYAGGNAAQLGLLSGQVDLTFDNLASAAANIRSGRLRALAITSAARASAMPDLPTIAEAGRNLGLGGFDVGTWFGLFGPAGLPADVLARLNKAFVTALNAPETRARMASLMAEPAPSSPEQFAAFVKAELAKYRAVVLASGAKVD